MHIFAQALHIFAQALRIFEQPLHIFAQGPCVFLHGPAHIHTDPWIFAQVLLLLSEYLVLCKSQSLISVLFTLYFSFLISNALCNCPILHAFPQPLIDKATLTYAKHVRGFKSSLQCYLECYCHFYSWLLYACIITMDTWLFTHKLLL
jgi:hypothetical protein